MIYYILLVLATLFYALSFLMSKKVEGSCHENLDTTVLFLFVTQVEVLLVMLVCLGGQLRFTPFSVLCVSMQAILLGTFTFLNLKTLGIVDVAKYSLYTMLGGMLVPFVYGILFANEGLTVPKILCCIFVSLALVVDGWGAKTKKKELFYLFAVFFVNGLFCVLSAIHQNSPYEKLNTLEYMSMQALIVCIVAGVFLLVKRVKTGGLHAVREKQKVAYLYMLIYGIVYYGAELILLVSIIHVPVSVQFPIITGGTLVFSALISLLSGETREKKRLFSLALSLAGLVFLAF